VGQKSVTIVVIPIVHMIDCLPASALLQHKALPLELHIDSPKWKNAPNAGFESFLQSLLMRQHPESGSHNLIFHFGKIDTVTFDPSLNPDGYRKWEGIEDISGIMAPIQQAMKTHNVVVKWEYGGYCAE
jgi:hypothetical protein